MAQNEIRVLSDLSLVGSLNFSTNFADFPANPSPRTMVVVKGVTYIYTELLYNSGYFSWQPVGIKQTSHLHTQGVPSTVWTVTHNFNSTDFAYFVYDTNHNMMFANIEIVDSNTVRIMLSTATAGTAVFFSIEYVSAQAINAASSVGIGSLTLRDANGILTANNNPVAMAQAVSDAFATVYTKPQTDSAISAAVGTEAAARVLGDADTLASANTFTTEQLMIVVSDLTANATTVVSASTEYTDTKVAEEASRATTAESELGSRIDSVISNTDSVALNSLSEVVTAFQSANGDITAAIAAMGTNASSVLATEVTRAEAAEALLTGNLSSEVSARIAADALNANAIATETSARASAVIAEAVVRSTAITAEVSRATAAEGVLTTNLASEVSARTSGDTATAANAKGYTDNAIANEVTARNSAVDSEATRATSAELLLASSLANEVTARSAADVTMLSNAKSYSDSSIATAIAAEVVARNASVSTVSTSTKTYIDGSISTEIAARIAGDAATLATSKTYTDGAVETEIVARIAADAATLVSARSYAEGSSAAETTRATAAELVLTTNLANEVTNRTAADAATLASGKTYTDSSVATEVTRATAAEVVLTGKITTTAAATLASANTYTDGAISTEVTARNLAISNASQSGSAKLITARTINGVSFDGSANISFGTDSVVEGTTNKYYTDARARAAISAGTGLAYSAATGVISSTITQYTDALARAAISVTGSGSYNSTTGVITVTGGVTSVSGKTGAVVLTVADVSGAAPQATTYTKAEVDAAIAAAITAFAATLYV